MNEAHLLMLRGLVDDAFYWMDRSLTEKTTVAYDDAGATLSFSRAFDIRVTLAESEVEAFTVTGPGESRTVPAEGVRQAVEQVTLGSFAMRDAGQR